MFIIAVWYQIVNRYSKYYLCRVCLGIRSQKNTATAYQHVTVSFYMALTGGRPVVPAVLLFAVYSVTKRGQIVATHAVKFGFSFK